MVMMMTMLLWVLAELTGRLVKWLLRWLGQIKVCLSTVPFDDVDVDDDDDDDDDNDFIDLQNISLLLCYLST